MLEQWLNSSVQNLIIGIVVIALLFIVFRFRRRIPIGSLGNQLLLAFIGVAAVSLALVVGVVIWQAQQILEAQTGQAFAALAQSNSQRFAEGLDREVELLKNLAREDSFFYQIFGSITTDLSDLSTQKRNNLLRAREQAWVENSDTALRSHVLANPTSIDLNNFIEDFPAHTQIVYVDQYGALVAYGGPEAEHYNYSNQTWWREAWNNGAGSVYVGDLQFTPGQPDATIDIAVPVQIPATGITQGVLRSRFLLRDLGVFAEFAETAGTSREITVVDEAGLILYSSNLEQIGQHIADEFLDDIIREDVHWGVGAAPTGQEIVHSHAVITELVPEQSYLDNLGWAFVVEQPTAEALSIVGEVSRLALGAGLVALLLAAAVSVYISQRISWPLAELTQTASAIAQGQHEETAKVTGPTEIKTLAQAFNRMTTRLEETLASLEERVRARTRRLELIASLGERLNAILDVDILLNEVVTQLKDNFGYYHAHIYLLDESKENLVVAAGAGEPGEIMKAEGHSIPVGAIASLVARAARTQEIVIVDNVREAADWLPNPLLPDTYSEMAVPIVVDNEVVGVLDVQQDRIAGLDEGDANLLRSLANQVSVAIRNVQVFEQVRTDLSEAQAVQQRYVEQAWDRTKVARRSLGRVQFSLGESTALGETAISQARQQALRRPEPGVVAINGAKAASPSGGDESTGQQDDGNNNEEQYAFVAPITLHNTPIGNLQLHEIDPRRQWTEGELAMVNAVIDQVAQAAENLRLLNETQERASRERLIGKISDRLRRAPDLESLMRIGVEELSKVLNPARTFVQFGPDGPPQPDGFESDAQPEAPTEHQSGNGASTGSTNMTAPQNGQGDK